MVIHAEQPCSRRVSRIVHSVVLGMTHRVGPVVLRLWCSEACGGEYPVLSFRLANEKWLRCGSLLDALAPARYASPPGYHEVPDWLSAKLSGRTPMSRKCAVTGKKRNVAKKVSHSHKRTSKIQNANIQTKRLWHEEENRWIKVRLSTRALRTISKKGLAKFLRDEGLRIKDIT
jgi:large subunit ribosomal protein L28